MKKDELKRKTVSGFFWRICERIAAQAISFVVTVVLARILTPEDYAPITLLTVFILIANLFVSDGFSAALIQKRDITALDYSSVLLAGLGISAVLYAVLFAAAPLIAAFYHMPVLIATLRVLALRLPLGAVNSVELAYLSRNMRFRSFFWGTFFGTAISAPVGIACALRGLGAWALVAQNLTNYTFDTLILALIIHKIPAPRFSMERVKPLIRFGYKILLTDLFFTLSDQLRTLIIGKRFAPSDLSYYSKGHQLPQLLSGSVTSPMASVLFPAMSAVNDEPERVKQVFRRSVQILSYAISPLMLGLAAVSERAVRLLLTEKWMSAVPFVWIFCVYHLFPPVHSINVEAVKSIGRSDEIFFYGILKRLAGLACLLAAAWFDAYAIAYSTVASAVLCSFVNAHQNQRLFGYGYREQLTDWLPNIALSAAMCAVTYAVGRVLPGGDLPVILCQTAAGIVSYAALSVLTRNPSFYYILEYALKRRGGTSQTS